MRPLFLAALLAAACVPRPAAVETDRPDAGGADAGPETPDAGPPLRVLFIGNSYTYVNDLPSMVARLAETSGVAPRIEVDSVTVGGYRLADHWDAGVAQLRIAEGGWTHVVLQGQSEEPALGLFNDYLAEPGEFEAGAARFGALVADAGAQPTWYVTWAHAAGDDFYANTDSEPDWMQDALTSSYARAAEPFPNSVLACAGEAFRSSLQQHPEIVLHVSDKSHPTLAGSYLAACTFYLALTGHPVPDASEVPAGISDGDAAALREMARVGSSCGDVRTKGMFVVTWGGDFAPAGTPVVEYRYFRNTGDAPVAVSDAMTLSPPFSWPNGSYPGFSGVTPNRTPACQAIVPPHSDCAVALGWTGAVDAAGSLTLNVGGAYRPTVTTPFSATRFSDAYLTLTGDPSTVDLTTFATVYAQPGAPAVFHLLLFNSGGATATGIVGATTYPMPIAPFAWGLPDAGDAFPGGTGSSTVDGKSYRYCWGELDAGEACVATGSCAPAEVGKSTGVFRVGFTAPDGGLSWAYQVISGYADAGT